MLVTPLKTRSVHAHDDLFEVLKESIKTLEEKSVVVVTSKIIGLCEGAVVPKVSDEKADKHEVVKKEAEWYLDPTESQYNLMLTIRDSLLAVNAGVDESNVAEGYVLFPKDVFASAEKIWHFLRKEFNVTQLGVLITDSKTFPLKWGTMGTALAHCGLAALNNKIGIPDLFGREMHMTQVNVSEGLAAAAVLEMGEVAESQPLCIITQADMVDFQDRPPTAEEIDHLKVDRRDDVYGPLLNAVPWQKGGRE